jgi:hypothetical protein
LDAAAHPEGRRLNKTSLSNLQIIRMDPEKTEKDENLEKA